MILDLSHYQGSIDWEQLSPELEFVILRATCGMTKDNRYSEYADNCKKYKVAYGTYHYLKASDEKTALEEAGFFYETASSKDPLFYVIDLEHENQNSSNSEIIVQTFAESLRAKGVGKIGLYTNRKYPYVKNIINIFDFIWVPRYGKDTGYPDAENYPPKYPCDLWQYTSKGTAPGIRGYVDKNQLYGDKPLEWFIERKGENNMAVIIGSARIDERGKAHGGQAGDQTGKEVSTQSWYKHSKGWVVLRPKDSEKARLIAKAMKAACDNSNIGYDQYQNKTLWNAVKDKGFDPAKATVKCETDCARLVRVCCAYAGIMADDFYTATEVSKLMATGEFTKLVDTKYTNSSDYLKVGDILVTKTKGHTVVVLTNGSKAESSVQIYELGDRILRDGDAGDDVEDLQRRLKAAGYDPGEIDGEYGPNTESAVKALQKDAGIEVDGEFGPNSLKALEALEVDDEPEEPEKPIKPEKPVEPSEPEKPEEGKGDKVVITGGNAWLRIGPSTEYDKAGIARSGDTLVYGNPNEWVPVLIDGRLLWVSNKYAKRV